MTSLLLFHQLHSFAISLLAGSTYEQDEKGGQCPLVKSIARNGEKPNGRRKQKRSSPQWQTMPNFLRKPHKHGEHNKRRSARVCNPHPRSWLKCMVFQGQRGLENNCSQLGPFPAPHGGYSSTSGDSFGYQRVEWRRVLLASGGQRLRRLPHSMLHASLTDS